MRGRNPAEKALLINEKKGEIKCSFNRVTGVLEKSIPSLSSVFTFRFGLHCEVA